MPNHFTNVLTVTGPADLIAVFRSSHIVASDKGLDFDFRTVVSQPECVGKTESGTDADAGFYALTGLVHVAFEMFAQGTPAQRWAARGYKFQPLSSHEHFAAWLREKHPDVIEKGKAVLRCFRETGHRDWYEWNIANWGTKWGSYEYKERESAADRFVFEFQTANGVAEPVFEELSRRYPGLKLDLVVIDEGGPEYVGSYSGGAGSVSKVPHDTDRYRFVYGRDPYTDDDESEAEASN
jgi:hypothetical protein